uniref:Ig-like domain-containing protein n=1 Tax=Leptobrachium leishanense TaxID=445787 RepID=A0A8C5M6D1_9ANUR
MLVEEGTSITISCTYSTSYTSAYNLFWYQHYTKKAPAYILHKANQGTLSNVAPFAMKRFKSQVDSHSTNLTITDLEIEDSAMYLCALQRNTASKPIFGEGTRLYVRPQATEKKEPSVYVLKANEQQETVTKSLCLATDFPSPPDGNITGYVNRNKIELTDALLLDRSSDETWRYGTTFWNEKFSIESGCKIDYRHISYIAEDASDDLGTCSSTTEEEFETDERVNTLTFEVLGLRCLVIKGIIFNLISTQKLWYY